jgi:ABC-type anion transport system duplicated permease subunit
VFIPKRLIVLLYVAIGVVVAWDHHYFEHFNTWRQVLSAFLAVLLWPLILLGVNLHLHK